jgi:predicted NAD-dependent protein-ADP-ribosyltransferase YbiA (DUF1768 family)
MEGTMEGEEVVPGTIRIGGAEENEQEGEEETKGETQVTEGNNSSAPGNDPFLSLPLATTNESQPASNTGTEEETEEEKNKEEGEEKEEEGEEEEEEEEEKGTQEKIGTFYEARRRYFNGTFERRGPMIDKLLKDNKKVAASMEGDIPKSGPYFIVVKDPPTENNQSENTSILFFPEKATYMSDGDVKVQVVSNKVEIVKDITIPTYRPLTKDELFDNMDLPKGRLETAQTNYNEAFTNMRVALAEENHANLKQRMNRLQLRDRQLLHARFPFRAVQKDNDILLKDLLFDRKHDDAKLDIGRFIGTTISLQKRYVTKAPAPSETPLGPVKNVLVINRPEDNNGILSPFYNQVPFEVEGVIYTSPYQAIIALLAIDPVIKKKSQKEKEELKEEIERQSNPRDVVDIDTTIRMGEEEALIEGAFTGLIEKVYREALRQIPAMALALTATGNTQLVVVPQERELDSFLGVGIDPNVTEGIPPKQRFVIQDTERWEGRNMYANVLMELRKAMQQEAPVLEEAPVFEEAPVDQGGVPAGSIELNEADEQVGEDEVPDSVIQFDE